LKIEDNMHTRKLKGLFPAITGVLLTTWIAVGLQQTVKVDDAALKNAGKANTSDWLTYGLNQQEQRYSLLKEIDATNVSRLGLAWTYEIGQGGGNQEATPLVSNGVLYSVTQWSIAFAVDAKTGRELWRYDPKIDRAATQPKICCGNVVRGLAIYGNKVFVPVMDGRLAALDATTGKEVWSVQTTPLDQPYTVTMAPRVAKGKVFIGNAGGEYPVRGFVTAYDTETGKLVWRFYTVPGDPKKGFESKAMEAAAKTWSGEWYKFGGGGTVWDGMTYDPDSNLLYFGTGNGGPWPSEVRQSKGLDNLYVCSIVAVNADTGEYKWHYQTVPEDSWDFDSVQQLTLADIRINGQARKVIMQANKSGFFLVLDRLTGKIISGEPFAQVNWASEIDLKTGRPKIHPEAFYSKSQAIAISPSAGGAHNWAPMSFNPTTNLMYIPITASGSMSYRLPDSFTYNAAGQNMGVTFAFPGGGGPGGPGGRGGPVGAPGPPPTGGIADPGAAIGAGLVTPALPPTPAVGATPSAGAAPVLPMIGPKDKDGNFYAGQWLIAIDPSTQQIKWRVQGGGNVGGTLTTAGNLVFQSLSNGHLLAYKADTGDKVFETSTNQNSGQGPPITYMVGGKQYIAVAGGSGPRGGGPGPAGTAAVPGGPPPVYPRVYVYTLDGKAENPTPVSPAAPAGGFGGFGPGGPGAPPAPGTPPAPAGRGQ
jgi:quinohemoprotein ethanol dehydrogenase